MELWLTIQEAANYAHMNRKTLERLARGKKIRYGRLGKCYRFKPEWIDRFLMGYGFDGVVR